MNQKDMLVFLHTIEKLKCNTRHSWTSSGRRESVAEHCWRTAVMALLCADEYPQLDMDKVVKMCLIHDFGEAITGDIPSFYKTDSDKKTEKAAVKELLSSLPADIQTAFSMLFDEMEKRETPEAKLCKSLDNLEAIVSHNEADIATWLPLEYEENLRYGSGNVEWSEWTSEMKAELNRESLKKIRRNENEKTM